MKAAWNMLKVEMLVDFSDMWRVCIRVLTSNPQGLLSQLLEQSLETLWHDQRRVRYISQVGQNRDI